MQSNGDDLNTGNGRQTPVTSVPNSFKLGIYSKRDGDALLYNHHAGNSK